ncbi:MAG: HNH endonuclease family protein, partial [Henriciella sp.]|uniref:HNH endonuclease family protein n=1 Tax=Henriciella sp. TaxID=1968823 RepID=UPI003C73446C
IETDESSNHSRMQENVRWLEKQLKKLSPAQRQALFETIRDRVVLVRVSVPDWNGGYDVFRVLNTRGKAPNSHDIVKTEILQKADLPVEEASAYARQWLDHEAKLGGGGLDELMNIIRQFYTKNPKGKTANEFAKNVLSKVDAKTFLDQDLPRYVEAFRMVLKGDPDYGEYSAAIKAPLDHLRLIDHSLWKVPAVAYIYQNPKDGAQALEFFKKLERFAYVMMLYVTDRGPRQKRYQKVTQAILAGKPLLNGGGPLYFSKDDVRKVRDRLTGRFGNFAQRRAIALRLNAALENGEPISPEEDATVEHVLPRAVPDDSFWNTVWPRGQVQRELCETVGNFVIVPQHINRLADRKDFREKKSIFFAEENRIFALTEDLRERQTWTAEDVRERTDHLASILMTVWFETLD